MKNFNEFYENNFNKFLGAVSKVKIGLKLPKLPWGINRIDEPCLKRMQTNVSIIFDGTSKVENQNNLVLGCSRAESYNFLTKTQNLVTPKQSGAVERDVEQTQQWRVHRDLLNWIRATPDHCEGCRRSRSVLIF